MAAMKRLVFALITQNKRYLDHFRSISRKVLVIYLSADDGKNLQLKN